MKYLLEYILFLKIKKLEKKSNVEVFNKMCKKKVKYRGHLSWSFMNLICLIISFKKFLSPFFRISHIVEFDFNFLNVAIVGFITRSRNVF